MDLKKVLVTKIDTSIWLIIFSLSLALVNIFSFDRTPIPLITNETIEHFLSKLEWTKLNTYRLGIVAALYLFLLFTRKKLFTIIIFTLIFIQFNYLFLAYSEIWQITQLFIFFPIIVLISQRAELSDLKSNVHLFLLIIFFAGIVNKLNETYLGGVQFLPGSEFFPFLLPILIPTITKYAQFFAYISVIIEIFVFLTLLINLRAGILTFFIFYGSMFMIAPPSGGLAFLFFFPFILILIEEKKTLPWMFLVPHVFLAILSWTHPFICYVYAIPIVGLITFLSCCIHFGSHWSFNQNPLKLYMMVGFLPISLSFWVILAVLDIVPPPLGFSMFSRPYYKNSIPVTQKFNKSECDSLSKKFYFRYGVAQLQVPDGCNVIAPHVSSFIRLNNFLYKL